MRQPFGRSVLRFSSGKAREVLVVSETKLKNPGSAHFGKSVTASVSGH